jgi:hypothetical protein
MRRRDESIPEIPQGSLGAAAMTAFSMSERAALLCFAKGNIAIDGQPLDAAHLRRDAEEYRGRYLQFYGRQALILGHRLVRDNEQLGLAI